MPRIFLVEDDPAVAQMVRDGVEMEGWEIERRDRVTGAIEALRGSRADILLLDINLPDGDGLSLLEVLKKDKAMARLPVIILTSSGDTPSRLKGFSLGAQDYVPKPFVLLRQRLESLIGIQYQNQNQNQKVALAWELSEAPLSPMTDATLVFRILVNLLSNALKVSKPGERVSVRLAASGSGIRITVTDSGPGIPRSARERIFLMFERANTSETMMLPGSGVGLAFCRLAAETLGGRIWAEDGDGGKGGRFVLDLPRLSN